MPDPRIIPDPKPLRIVFIGAECTGKTTLSRAIAAHFREPCSTEYVRQHAEKIKRPLDASDLDPIARGQIKLEDDAFAQARKWVFHDTNLLSSILYAEHYFSTHIAWADEAFLKRNYATYFLCEPDFPWEADPGQRESPEERIKLQCLFEVILRRYEIPFVRLKGPLPARVDCVIKQLKKQ